MRGFSANLAGKPVRQVGHVFLPCAYQRLKQPRQKLCWQGPFVALPCVWMEVVRGGERAGNHSVFGRLQQHRRSRPANPTRRQTPRQVNNAAAGATGQRVYAFTRCLGPSATAASPSETLPDSPALSSP
jgi:hypothetical protein